MSETYTIQKMENISNVLHNLRQTYSESLRVSGEKLVSLQTQLDEEKSTYENVHKHLLELEYLLKTSNLMIF